MSVRKCSVQPLQDIDVLFKKISIQGKQVPSYHVSTFLSAVQDQNLPMPTRCHQMVIAEQSPDKFGWIYVFADEICMLMQTAIENHHLNNYGSSFSENFYSLKRVAVASKQGNEASPKLNNIASPMLPLPCKIRSLLCLAILPYLKEKCDRFYEDMKRQEEEQNQQKASLVWRLFSTIYPYAHMTWQGTLWAFHLLYTVGLVERHSPFLYWCGVQLQYVMPSDNIRDSSLPELFAGSDLSLGTRLFSVLRYVLRWLSYGLSSSLSVGIFFLQFVDWWYSRNTYSKPLTALAVPQPPAQPLNVSGLPQLHTICPLCNKIRHNDTALSVSGYVFCYPCIRLYVSEHGCCPITRYPAQLQHLIRLFLPNSA